MSTSFLPLGPSPQAQNFDDVNLNLGELDLTSEDFLLEEVDVHIQQNLEDEFVKEALKAGVDLRQYSKQIEKELLEVENASIQDYIKESQNIASLHTQIAACDNILERMEQMLNGFQGDLSSISNEIQTLQDQSIAMNVKLKNRQAIRGELSQFVDEMVIPESMITHILDSPVTDREFLEQLHELNHKINFVKEQSFRDARSCQDVKDILDKLKMKAIAKIREFLLQKINSFRKPMSNYQISQNTMLKFRFFNEFLMANERHVAKEVRDEYIDTMSKIYYSYFKGYSSRLMKLQFEEMAGKDDLMGVEDTAKKSFFSSKPHLKNRSTVFTLGNRGEILTSELEAPVIVPHAAQKSDARYTFETLFRSLHFALMDNCCREFLFVVDFYMAMGSVAQNLFDAIMGKTLTMFMVTRRYAEFSAAIIGINQSYPNERTDRLLGQLQTEVENFILKMAAAFPHRKEQLVYLINNYDMMLGVLMERTSEDSKETESFKELLQARTQEFVEEILAPHFGGMISFVKDCEVLVERGQIELLKNEEKRIQQIVRGFNNDWKRALEVINQDVMRSFTNFKNGTQILQGALTQLIQYYHRFQKVLSQGPFRNMQIRNELINIHHVMVEVKKYKPNF
ncbi:vacuolar protein sorting-associated protein 52 homolog [Gigantopelta aegis]|uniref:vacuolar protein sorting-associated protein 52 homolog n=1 Tax=Gigantopelta aegis TaxID=1735272 RepID=UPI001B889FB2|nr:vacuolar protein sorting-associated protein 52 homolog [Gigantopelta aegis]